MKPSTNQLNTRLLTARSARWIHLFIMAVSALLASASAYAASTAWSGGGEADLNWSNAANWTNGSPTATTDTYFVHDAAIGGPGSANNQLSADRTVQSLNYQNTNGAHSTLIDPGVTLTVSNAGSGYAFWGGGVVPLAGAVRVANSYIHGQGTLLMNAPTAIMSARFSQPTTSGSGSKYTIDMSGLDNFTATLSRLYVAGDVGNRPNGAMYLAKTNLIMLGYTSGPSLLVGNCGTGAAGGELYLGDTNAIFGNGIWLGFRRASTPSIQFNPNLGMGATAYFRNRAGTGPMTYWRIGDGSTQAYSGNAANGKVDFTLGTVDALVDELVVGRNFNSISTVTNQPAGGSLASLTFNSGTIEVNTALIGYQMLDYGPRVDATVSVDGTGTLIVNNSMLLGNFKRAGAGNGTSKALLNVGVNGAGGTVIVKGPITTTTSEESENWSEIVIKSGSLSAKTSIGPLNWLELTAGTLSIDFDTAPAAPVCSVTNLITAPGFNLTLGGAGLEVGQFPIIKYWLPLYSGVGADDLVLSIPFYLEGYLSNNVANSSIDLVITKKLISVWNGNQSDIWDIGTTENWKDGVSGTSKTYGQSTVPGDIVKFDDTAIGNGSVILTTDLSPFHVTIDNTNKAYNFGGTGRLTGDFGLVKTGPGTLTIGNSGANDFEGGVFIQGGTLQISGPDRLPVNATVTLTDASGAQLDLNNQDQTLDTISGGGSTGGNVSLGSGTLRLKAGGTYGGLISGNGKLVKTDSGTLTLSGANTFSGGTVLTTNAAITVVNPTGSALGTGNIDIGSGSILRIGDGNSTGNPGAGVITNNGSLVVNVPNDITFANLITGTDGSITKSFANNTLTLGSANDFGGVLFINAGAVRVTHPMALGSSTSPLSEFSTAIASAATARLELANDVTLNETIYFSMKSGTYLRNPGIMSVSGVNTLNGPILLNVGGSVHNFYAEAGSKLIINSPISATTNWNSGFPYHALDGSGEGVINSSFVNGFSFTSMTNSLYKLGTGTWTLAGENTYIGFTVISNGTLVVTGSILGTNTAPMPAGFWIGCLVRAEGTLKGDGVIHCVVTNAGTLSPGNSVGTLTINNDLVSLPGSSNLFEIENGQFDQITGLTSVTYGGTLKVNLIGALAGGEVFKLFTASSYSETTFDTFDLPVLEGGLSWDTTQLTVDGTLRVVGAGIQVGQFQLLSDGNFQMSGTSGLTGAYRVLATTNLVDTSSWIQVGTGVFESGAFSFTDLEATNHVQRYYQIVAP